MDLSSKILGNLKTVMVACVFEFGQSFGNIFCFSQSIMPIWILSNRFVSLLHVLLAY